MVGGPDRSNTDGPLSGFGLNPGDDSWIGLLREAEQPLVMGCSGRYELLSEVSRGGQGIVYRARDVRSGRIVAAKRLVAGSLASLSSRRRFERELETAAALDHPNIVRVFGLDGGGGGQPLLTMQWIDGVPITEWAAPPDRVPPSQREILGLFVKVCSAVHHAHQRGVIHRDLKPSNILVDVTGEPHLLDFGLAKLLAQGSGAAAGDSGVTLSGQFLGTPAYASPEQVRGGPGAIDVRSDVYSLGVMLYRVLTGHMPYPVDGGLADVFQSIQHSEPRTPSPAAGIDRGLRAVLFKVLAKDPRDRYQSANRLGTELSRYLRGDALEARADGRLYVLAKTLRRHRLAATAATAFLLLLVGFSVTMSLMYRRAGHEADRARQAQHFLQEMLASASPYRDGENLDVAAMLRRADERIDTDLAGQPQAQADMHLTIAQIYAGLWKWRAAEPHLRIALARYGQVYGREHPQIAVCLTLLGRALTFQHQPGAEAVQRKALGMRQRLYGEVHPLVAETYGGLGFAIWQTADPPRPEEAERNYRRALDLYSRSVTGPLDHWARTAYSLGSFLFDENRIEESIVQHETALNMYRAMSGSGDVYMNQVLEAYGWSLKEAGRYDEAVAAIEESIALRPAGFADERVAGLHWNLGGIHHHRGDDGRALDEYDESLALRCEILARRTSGHESSLRVHALRLRDHEHDADVYGEMFAVLDAVAPIREIMPWTVAVAAALEATQGRRAADTLLRRVLALMNDQGRNGGRETSTDIARARSYLGGRLIGLKRYEMAEDQLHEAYAVLRRVRGESCPYTRGALVNLVRLYEAWDNPAAVEAYRERLRQSRPEPRPQG